MTEAALVKALKRDGWTIHDTPRVAENGKPYRLPWADKAGRRRLIRWYPSGPNVNAVNVHDRDDRDDPQSDYSAGSFIRTIRRAIAFANRN